MSKYCDPLSHLSESLSPFLSFSFISFYLGHGKGYERGRPTRPVGHFPYGFLFPFSPRHQPGERKAMPSSGAFLSSLYDPKEKAETPGPFLSPFFPCFPPLESCYERFYACFRLFFSSFFRGCIRRPGRQPCGPGCTANRGVASSSLSKPPVKCFSLSPSRRLKKERGSECGRPNTSCLNSSPLPLLPLEGCPRTARFFPPTFFLVTSANETWVDKDKGAEAFSFVTPSPFSLWRLAIVQRIGLVSELGRNRHPLPPFPKGLPPFSLPWHRPGEDEREKPRQALKVPPPFFFPPSPSPLLSESLEYRFTAQENRKTLPSRIFLPLLFSSPGGHLQGVESKHSDRRRRTPPFIPFFLFPKNNAFPPFPFFPPSSSSKRDDENGGTEAADFTGRFLFLLSPLSKLPPFSFPLPLLHRIPRKEQQRRRKFKDELRECFDSLLLFYESLFSSFFFPLCRLHRFEDR